MKTKQVKYKFGDDVKFNYVIVLDRKDVEIDKESLAYKIDANHSESFLLDYNGIQATGDLVLRVTTKEDEFVKLIFCNYDDINKI